MTKYEIAFYALLVTFVAFWASILYHALRQVVRP